MKIGGHMGNNKKSIFIRIIFFVILSLVAQVFIIISSNKKTAKQTIVSRAQEVSQCFHVDSEVGTEQAEGGSNFIVSLNIVRDKGPEGHIFMFPPSCQVRLNVLRGASFPYSPEYTDSPIFVPNGSSKNVKYDVKIDECNELGNRLVTSCDFSVDESGNPSSSCSPLPYLPDMYPVCKQEEQNTQSNQGNQTNQQSSPVSAQQQSYSGNILPLGAHLAANNNPVNYQQIREFFNAQNQNNKNIANRYIPVTIVYDLFFLKGSVQGIQNNLESLKKFGLFPLIRVASYTGRPPDGKCNDLRNDCWLKVGVDDARILGFNLASALQNVAFAQKPIVIFFNEVNLPDEWGGEVDPGDFAQSFNAFVEGLNDQKIKNKNFLVYFPALSYGWGGATRSISPIEFFDGFFNSKKFNQKLDGVDLNIYGSDYSDIRNQYAGQTAAFDNYGQYFNGNGTTIGELGPVRGSQAVGQCEQDKAGWQDAAQAITAEYVKNPITIATMGCFGAVTYPAIIHYNEQSPELIKLNDSSGQVKNAPQNNNVNNTNQKTNPNQKQNQVTNTATTTINFDPQNPKADTTFKVVTTSGTGFTWVHIKIFNTEGKKLIQEAGKKPGQPNVSKTKDGYQWTYDADGIKEGDYRVVFYSNCDKGCKEQASRPLSIGTGKTNEVQQTNNQQVQKQQTAVEKNQETKAVEISTPGKITLDVSLIDPIDPYVLEYCERAQTSNAGCINPHDQKVENGKVTMSFPDGNPAIFCGSIPEKRRAEVNGSDRSCVVFLQQI